MKRPSLPEGYAVVQFHDKQWYPLEVYQIYSAIFPDGCTSVHTLFNLPYEEISFSTQREALLLCQKKAQEKETNTRGCWERLVQRSNVYPERCAQYISIIEQVTGQTPILTTDYSTHAVFVIGDWCPHCDHCTGCVSVAAMAIEDALAEAAEQVYEKWCQCRQMNTAYQELCTA